MAGTRQKSAYDAKNAGILKAAAACMSGLGCSQLVGIQPAWMAVLAAAALEALALRWACRAWMDALRLPGRLEASWPHTSHTVSRRMVNLHAGGMKQHS